ncbi:hypothetical protein AURDEDRAFT_131838, partial [Auricularia subglabra TFB-10046 SS5]
MSPVPLLLLPRTPPGLYPQLSTLLSKPVNSMSHELCLAHRHIDLLEQQRQQACREDEGNRKRQQLAQEHIDSHISALTQERDQARRQEQLNRDHLQRTQQEIACLRTQLDADRATIYRLSVDIQAASQDHAQMSAASARAETERNAAVAKLQATVAELEKSIGGQRQAIAAARRYVLELLRLRRVDLRAIVVRLETALRHPTLSQVYEGTQQEMLALMSFLPHTDRLRACHEEQSDMPCDLLLDEKSIEIALQQLKLIVWDVASTMKRSWTRWTRVSGSSVKEMRTLHGYRRFGEKQPDNPLGSSKNLKILILALWLRPRALVAIDAPSGRPTSPAGIRDAHDPKTAISRLVVYLHRATASGESHEQAFAQLDL